MHKGNNRYLPFMFFVLFYMLKEKISDHVSFDRIIMILYSGSIPIKKGYHTSIKLIKVLR